MTIDLRVLSYNIHAQRDDTAALGEVVRATDPDVVIVQEGPRRFRWRQRCASLARSFNLVVGGGGLPALGNLVLTSLRVRVHDTRCLRFPLTPGRHLRGAVLVDCSVGGVGFTVVGSHLSTDAAERPAQATLLKEAMAEAPAPLIVGADLNENSAGGAWRTLGDGLTDTAEAGGGADRCTFSCAHPRDRIDVLFADPALVVRRYEVIDTPQVRRASDHFPVLVDLSLPR